MNSIVQLIICPIARNIWLGVLSIESTNQLMFLFLTRKMCLKRKLSILPSSLQLYFWYLFHRFTYGIFAADSTNTRQLTHLINFGLTGIWNNFLKHYHNFFHFTPQPSSCHFRLVLLRPWLHKSMKCFLRYVHIFQNAVEIMYVSKYVCNKVSNICWQP